MVEEETLKLAVEVLARTADSLHGLELILRELRRMLLKQSPTPGQRPARRRKGQPHLRLVQ